MFHPAERARGSHRFPSPARSSRTRWVPCQAAAASGSFVSLTRRPSTAMDSDRKYRQRGYQDNERDSTPREPQKPKGPRPPLDVTGPRLPRMVQAVTASRCWNCATTLPETTDFKATCPKCATPLHCCKQCAHFEPSTRFQCLKPIPARIPQKDQNNECDLFSARVTVARDSAGPSAGSFQTPGGTKMVEPRRPSDARAAFDSLFKK